MNKRIQELAEQAGLAEAADVRGGYIYPAGIEKFAELIVKELVADLQVEGSNFYYNRYNDQGCITVHYFVSSDPNRMCGESVKAEFGDGKIKDTGRYRLNDQFVRHLMERCLGDKQ